MNGIFRFLLLLCGAGLALVAACRNDPDDAPAFPVVDDPDSGSSLSDSGQMPSTSSSSSSSGSSGSSGTVAPANACPTTAHVGDPMTCTWLMSADNCWAAALKTAAACGEMVNGTFSADHSTCTELDTSAKFAAPYPTDPLTPNTKFAYSFASTEGGTDCYSLSVVTPPPSDMVWDTVSLSITTPAGCVSLTTSGSAYTVTCEDGASHTGDVVDLNDECRTPIVAFNTPNEDISLDLYYGSNAVGIDELEIFSTFICHP